MTCVLCASQATQFHAGYWHCHGDCGMVFLDPAQRLSEEEEKARYDLHNNDPEDSAYRKFLRRLTDKVIPRLPAGAHGLDFGCGPGPALSQIMQEAGFAWENYDPYYFPDESLRERSFHCITATEVFEHLYDPRTILDQLNSMLKPGGMLAIMTEMLHTPVDASAFAKWWYITDPTHVSLYSTQTFEWIARQYNWGIDFPCKNVVLFSS